MASLQSSLNQGLFFLGLGEVLGIYCSAIDRRVLLKSSMLIFFEVFRVSLHFFSKLSQSALLKLKRSGIVWVIGISC